MTTVIAAGREKGGETEIDVVQEMRLRTWARKNFCPPSERDETWHPVILDEMRRKDRES